MEEEERQGNAGSNPQNGAPERPAKHDAQHAQHCATKAYQNCKEACAQLRHMVQQRWSSLTSGLLPDRKLELVFTFVIAGSTLLYAAVASWQLRLLGQQIAATQTAANAATSAAKTAAQQLELSERPWMSAEIGIMEPLTFKDKLGIVKLSVSLKNTGHSVAVDVLFRSKVFAGELSRIASAQAEWCEPLRHRGERGLSGTMIFPNDRVQTAEITNIDPEEVTSALKTTSVEGKIMMMLLTCIDYRFAFSSEHHQSRYVFMLGQPQEAGGWMGFFSPDGRLEGVTLIESYNGNSAD